MIPRMRAACAIAAAILFASGTAGTATRHPPVAAMAEQAGGYADLVSLFTEWRAFQKPKLTDGVPDYTAEAMSAQQRELPAYQRRLAAIDPGAGRCRSRSTGTSSAPR